MVVFKVDQMLHNHPAKPFIMTISLIKFLLILTLSSSKSNGQQHYSGNTIMACNNSDQTGPSPSFLYTCNGQPSCKAFLMFKTKPPYLSLSSISNLTSSDPTEVSRLNNISSSSFLPPDNNVILPVTCSCSGKYYQANASYVIASSYETYFTIANYMYQGLATCDALKRENPYSEFDLSPRLKLKVPLRCACPTQEQVREGTKFLLTFLISQGDSVRRISEKFNVSTESISKANWFPNKDQEIYPFTTILVPLPTKPLSFQMKKPFSRVPQKKNKRTYKGLYIGIGIGTSLSVVCFLLVLSFVHYTRKRTTNASWKERLPENFLEKVVGIGETLKIYAYEELQAATNNFCPQKRLSNTIYIGALPGKQVAIKKTSKDVSKEIKILGNVNHFNVISLYGLCEHNRIYYLVYEYLEEGSLKDWLSKEECPLTYSWNHRILIALDIANGLDYLHNFTSPSYVHKDINSCNILLNRDLRAKIANFTFAREGGNTHASRIVGKRGYLAPEYVRQGLITPKIDVYAFGVVLLELITGRRAVYLHDGRDVHLSETVVSVMDRTCIEDEIDSLIDPRLQVKHPLGYVIDHTELALRMLKLSVACLGQEPTSRLSMAEVVSSLMKIQLDVYNHPLFSVE